MEVEINRKMDRMVDDRASILTYFTTTKRWGFITINYTTMNKASTSLEPLEEWYPKQSTNKWVIFNVYYSIKSVSTLTGGGDPNNLFIDIYVIHYNNTLLCSVKKCCMRANEELEIHIKRVSLYFGLFSCSAYYSRRPYLEASSCL